ncbi:DUF4395 domain-containing protein [Deinococcus koreensis]|uniref:DUF4395 domain-containing protein n=1 Tax=Deinococcus koreensis TaxID=2054903 RepID=A0A2K3V1D5_9DEIO|nr:DUF4395 domain-containing protein [Deinococcus koreensis]PNY82588.1 DUF4395 domain-containing protein [Deinococcus koreensis]
MITSPSSALRQPARTDLSALRFNQLAVVSVTLLAVILTLPWLTLALGLAMLVGAPAPEVSPMRAAYRVLGPVLGLKPEVVEEDPRAHHFAQGVGGVFLLASALATFTGLSVLGALLGVLVIALAVLNLSKKICVGCLMYFQYRRARYVILKR